MREVRFAVDSPLEGGGFEPSVPGAKEPGFFCRRRIPGDRTLTFNAISSRDQRCGSFEPKRRVNGGMRWRQCDRASCFGLLRSREVNLTTPARPFPLIFMTSGAERKRLLGRSPWPLI